MFLLAPVWQGQLETRRGQRRDRLGRVADDDRIAPGFALVGAAHLRLAGVAVAITRERDDQLAGAPAHDHQPM